MQFGWISCGQELAHCIAVPSRMSETVPSSAVEVWGHSPLDMAFGFSVPSSDTSTASAGEQKSLHLEGLG